MDTKICNRCAGTGDIAIQMDGSNLYVDDVCPVCDGSGHIKVEEHKKIWAITLFRFRSPDEKTLYKDEHKDFAKLDKITIAFFETKEDAIWAIENNNSNGWSEGDYYKYIAIEGIQLGKIYLLPKQEDSVYFELKNEKYVKSDIPKEAIDYFDEYNLYYMFCAS